MGAIKDLTRRLSGKAVAPVAPDQREGQRLEAAQPLTVAPVAPVAPEKRKGAQKQDAIVIPPTIWHVRVDGRWFTLLDSERKPAAEVKRGLLDRFGERLEKLEPRAKGRERSTAPQTHDRQLEGGDKGRAK